MIEIDLSTKVDAAEINTAKSKVTKVVRFDKKYKGGDYYQYLKHGKIVKAPVEEYAEGTRKLNIKDVYTLADGTFVGVVSRFNKELLALGMLALIAVLSGGTILFLQKEESHLGKWDKQTDSSNIEINKEQSSDDAQEYIDFPTYANVVVTEEKPQISLINFPQNTVYMYYKIYLMKDDGMELLHESVSIPPDKMEQYNIWKELDAGVYDICYEKYTQDIESLKNTTTASEIGKLTVIK